MLDYLNGTVTNLTPQTAVLECNGIGYACQTTQLTRNALAAGKPAKLYTYLHVRENALDLYGFLSEGERNCFQMLIGISGVGPKAALAILSASTPEQLTLSILNEDTKALTKIPGVGKKIAQRVIVELKDRLAKGELSAFSGISLETYGGSGQTAIPENKFREASTALEVLGYSTLQIASALQGIDLEAYTLEEIIKQALKKMM